MRICLKQYYDGEVALHGEIRPVQRDESGAFFIEGTDTECNALKTVGMVADDSLPEDPVVFDKLQDPNVKETGDSEGRPYLCPTHGELHAPGSSEYFACYPGPELATVIAPPALKAPNPATTIGPAEMPKKAGMFKKKLAGNKWL